MSSISEHKPWTLRRAISAAFATIILLLTIVYALINYFDHYELIEEYSSAIFTEKQHAIRESLDKKFRQQANINNLTAQTLASLYHDGGIDAVDSFLLHGLKHFDGIAASFFTTKENEFTGYVKNDQFIRMFANKTTDFSIIFAIVNAEGNITETLSETPGFLATKRPWYTSAITPGQEGFGNVFMYHAYQTLALPHSKPVYNKDGSLLGVAGNNIFLNGFSNLLQELTFSFDGIAIILDRDNKVIASSLDAPIPFHLEKRSKLTDAALVRNSFSNAASEQVSLIPGNICVECDLALIHIEGEDYRVGAFKFDEIPNIDWRISLFIPEAKFQKNIIEFVIEMIAIITIILLIATFLSLRVSQLISRPIDSIVRRFSAINNEHSNEPVKDTPFILREVSNLQHASETYEKRLNIWKEVFDSTSVAMAISTNNDNTIDIVNPAFAKVYGGTVEDFQGLETKEFFPIKSEQQAKEIYQAVQEKGHYTFETEFNRINGEKFPALLQIALVKNQRGEVIARVASTTDLTDSKQLHQELFQSQKLQAIGTLAGGIVHDMNNVLTSILGNAELGKLKNQSADTSSIEQNTHYFTAIEKAAERGSKLTQQVLSFSRMEALAKSKVNIHQLLTEAIELISATMPSHINCSYKNEFSHDTVVIANESQLQQVVLNLLSNAVKAIKKSGKSSGQIDITTCRTGEELVVVISDNGTGISEEQMQYIFDPFYTTESKGKGTGLGLAIVKRILDSLEIGISVASQIDEYTEFKLSFSHFTQGHAVVTDTSNIRQESISSDTRKILLVDDDSEVSKVLGLLLEEAGYAVHILNNPQEALDYMGAHFSEISLLITDFDMPQMSGEDLVHKLGQEQIQPPTIMLTGYNETMTESKLVQLDIKKLLTKPISSDALIKALHEVLNDK